MLRSGACPGASLNCVIASPVNDFALRTDIHQRLRRHRATISRRAIALEINDLIFGCHSDGDSLNPMLFHLPRDICTKRLRLKPDRGNWFRLNRRYPR